MVFAWLGLAVSCPLAAATGTVEAESPYRLPPPGAVFSDSPSDTSQPNILDVSPSTMAKIAKSSTTPAIYSHLPFVGRSPWPTPLIDPEPLLSLLPHPEKTAPPQPLRPELAPPPAGWMRSLHAAPAAYPKILREAHGTLDRLSHPWRTSEPKADETKEERVKRQAGELVEAVKQRYAAKHWSVEEAKAASPPGLWLAVERWKRDKPTGGHTLVLTHANGLQKEVRYIMTRLTTALAAVTPGHSHTRSQSTRCQVWYWGRALQPDQYPHRRYLDD